MSKRPWMPLYVADYLGDTAHLTITQSGAYLHLLMHYWLHGGLPTSDQELARIVRMTDDEWKSARTIVQRFFAPGWKHKRVEFELTEAARLSRAGKLGGMASGRARRERSLNDQANDLATKREALHSHSHIKKERVSIETPKKESAAGRTIGVLPDAVASPEAVAFAAALGWSTARIDTEWDRFRDWHLASGTRRKDVLAAWRNWCRSPLQNRSTGAAPRPGSREDRAERMHHALQKLDDYIARTDDAEPGGEVSPSPFGLLSGRNPSRS